MNRRTPDADTIRTALTLATRAPSIHNCQPWRWQVRRDAAGAVALALYADRRLRLPHTDPDGRDLILSCGAALNHCVVALAALGWRSAIDQLPDPADDALLATIALCPDAPDDVEVTLAAAIARRRTDRRRYGPRPVPAGDIALMGARSARLGVMLRRFDTLDTLNKIVAQAVSRHLGSRDYLAELTAWSGRYGSVAGVPARSTPVPDPAAALPARVFAGAALDQPPSSEPDHAVLLALGTAADDRLAWLRAGQATSAVLLTATSRGLAGCPVTEPLEVADTRRALRADVFGASGHPQMLLRIGWAPTEADPLPPTPRRELSAVVEWAGPNRR